MTNETTALQILVVDDESLIRWSLAETLRDEGHTVKEAGDARGTMDALSSGWEPDVILLDFRLPDSDDLRLLGNIRRLVPRSAVIMMTAFSTPEIVADATKLGVYRVMTKPLDMTEMQTLVRRSHASRSRAADGH